MKEFVNEIELAAERPEFANWEQQRRIFSVVFEGRRVYPAFQFSADGLPLPVMEELLSIFRKDTERSTWQNAFWFVSNTGWLDGSTPIEVLDVDPKAVLFAANQDIQNPTEDFS